MSMKIEAKSGIDQKNEEKEEIWQIAFNYLFFYEPGGTQVSECKAVMKMECTKPLLFNMEQIFLYM